MPKMERENSNMYVILNFAALDFLIHKIEECEFQKKIMSLFTNFYTHPAGLIVRFVLNP